MADDSSFSTRIRERAKYYFSFPKAFLFTFASFFSRAVVDYAFLGYIFVLIQDETGNIRTAALISTAYECVSPFLYGFLGRPSYRLMPYLITNLITDASFVAGILMLWFKAPHWSSGILYLALALLVVGRTGDMLTTRFLFHYIRLGDDNITVKKVLDRIDVWRSIGRCPGAILGLWISELERKLAFEILAIVTIIGYVFLICGILYHKCQKNERNPEETSNPSQEINQSSQKCSRIKQAMQLLKLLLLYIPFLIYYVVEGAGKTFFYEQVDKLDDHIENIPFGPAAFLYAIQKASGLLTSLLMKILIITKLWKESKQWHCAKLILGMLVCFCCCICSWYVESRRLNSEHMSNLLMVPQFVLLGIAKELVEDGMEDVFFFHVKTSMHLWFSAFSCFVEGLGASLGEVFIVAFGKWIRTDIDESRLDKYYFLLAMLTILAMFFFIGLWKFYAPKIKAKKDDEEGTELRQLEEGKNLSRSHSPQPTESPAESTSPSSDQVALLSSSNLDTSKSSSNSDSSIVKRSLSYPDQPPNPAANIHYQRFHTHPKTKYEGITHQSSALSNLRPRLAAKSIHERSDDCSEMN